VPHSQSPRTEWERRGSQTTLSTRLVTLPMGRQKNLASTGHSQPTGPREGRGYRGHPAGQGSYPAGHTHTSVTGICGPSAKNTGLKEKLRELRELPLSWRVSCPHTWCFQGPVRQVLVEDKGDIRAQCILFSLRSNAF
jgi:hypothetical protein